MGALLALRGTQGDERDRVSKMLTDAAVALDAIAENKHNARREAEHALVRVDTAVTALKGPEASAAQRFSKQLQEAAEFRFPDLLQPDVMNPLRAALTEVRKHLTWASPILRHAVRLSAAVALAIAADRFAPIAYGEWIALTVLFVLRPETAHTYTRCVGRVGGAAGGIIVASLVTTIWQPTGAIAAVMTVACLAITFWVMRFGYIAASAGVAAAVVFLLDINAAAGGATVEDRLFSVVIGGGLAVMAHVVLPDHALTRSAATCRANCSRPKSIMRQRWSKHLSMNSIILPMRWRRRGSERSGRAPRSKPRQAQRGWTRGSYVGGCGPTARRSTRSRVPARRWNAACPRSRRPL